MSIGDLANVVAQELYANRVLVAIVSIVAAVAVVALAYRMGWFGAARRHPGRAAGLIAVALVVGAPLAWYLGSPIFIRTSLVEAAPSLAPASVAPTVSPGSGEPTGEPSTAPTDAPATSRPSPSASPFVPATVATGEFTGTDEFHFGHGTASIIEVEPGRFHLRFEEFSVRNGPDLYVYLSPEPDGWTEEALEVGLLKATDGAFGYDLPAGTDPADFASALIWCKQFSHLFATAPFGACPNESRGYTPSRGARTIPLANATEASVAR